MPGEPPHIVVVGGGAAGLELVTKLGDTVGRAGRARVTLVERGRTHLWKLLLHAVAAGSVDRTQHELNYLAQAHWHHFTYRFGELAGLDRARDFGSLVPLGKYSTVGNLMGFLVGGSMFIEGCSPESCIGRSTGCTRRRCTAAGRWCCGRCSRATGPSPA